MVALALNGGLGCSKSNAAFGDGDTDASQGTATGGSKGDSATASTSPPPETTDDTSGHPPDTATGQPPPDTASVTEGDSTSDDSRGEATSYGSETTALGSETGDGRLECEVGEMPCSPFTGAVDCAEGWACRPQGGSDSGYEQNACVETAEGDDVPAPSAACSIECHRYSGIDDCAAGDLCDPFQNNESARRCTELCTGSTLEPQCTGEQSCVREDGEDPLFGLCRQHCSPFNETSCTAMVCAALGEEVGPQFVCVPPIDDVGEEGANCEGPGDCNAGLQCADCPDGSCCAFVCNPSNDPTKQPCNAGDTCRPYNVAGGHALIPGTIGVCVP